jgi:hypothetical protein
MIFFFGYGFRVPADSCVREAANLLLGSVRHQQGSSGPVLTDQKPARKETIAGQELP